MLRIDESPGKGRGVFALRKYAAGETIEDAPVIVLPASQREYLKKTSLFHYFFNWGEREDSDCAVCLGFGSLYNHSTNPNAKYTRIYANQIMRFLAIKDIEKGDEICTNYNGSAFTKQLISF